MKYLFLLERRNFISYALQLTDTTFDLNVVKENYYKGFIRASKADADTPPHKAP